MKTTIKFLMGGLLVSLAFAASLQAAEDSGLAGRDNAVDSQLIKNQGWMGALPPTRGEGMAAASATATSPFVNPTLPRPKFLPGLVTKGRTDHVAKVYEIKGKAKISKSNSRDWKNLKNGAEVEAGDVILTE